MESWCIIGAALGAWVIAQVIKTVITWIRQPESRNWKATRRNFTRSGGMPSGHSAVMWSATTVLGLSSGFQSAVFALAAIMAVVVMYDATHVRYEAGELAKRLNTLVKKDQQVKVVEGHTFGQVMAGALLGVIVGIVVFLGWLA